MNRAKAMADLWEVIKDRIWEICENLDEELSTTQFLEQMIESHKNLLIEQIDFHS